LSFGPHHDAKEQVRQAIDLVEVVSRYLDLRPQGRDFVGHCPWHDDARPSLRVNRERQSWKCWVCNIGGDAFSFVMRKEGVGFREALEMLAERAGIELSVRGVAIVRGSSNDKRTLYQAVAWAEEQFHRCLLSAPEAEPARRYLQQRGLNADSLQRHRVGFSPAGWQWLLDRARSTPYSPEVLETVGLVGRSERSGNLYDFFRGRIVFPIRDPQKRPIAFGGRVLPDDPEARGGKYINSRETRLFSKSEQFYGLDVVGDNVRRTRHATIMEGYTDVIMAIQQGLTDAIAVLGTALNQRHLHVLRRYTDAVTLVLDGDTAGQRRTNELLELFVSQQMDVRILTLPEGQDPCDFLQSRGATEFQRLAADAPDALEHKLRLVTQGLDAAKDTHRANQALEEMLRIIALAPAGEARSATRLREQQLLPRLSREFFVAEQDLRLRLDELRRSRRATTASAPSAATGPAAAPPSLRQLAARDVELLEILILEPALIGQLAELHEPVRLPPGVAQEILEIFQRVWREAGSADFPQIMAQVEDADVKSLLVELDEQAREKAERAEQSPLGRLAAWIDSCRRQATDQQRRRQMSSLNETLDAGQELNLLQEIQELARQTRGE
jgi:DNA primase